MVGRTLVFLSVCTALGVGCRGDGSGEPGSGGGDSDASQGDGDGGVDGPGDGDDGGSADQDGGGDDGPNFPPPGPPGGDACPGLSCLPCGNGLGCAADGPMLEGTCCAEGDALVYRGLGTAAEVVDLESDGEIAILCGGFGARVNDVTDPGTPVFVGSASERCQHASFGPELASGRIFYVAHHGDTWVQLPHLSTYRIDANGNIDEIHKIEDAAIQFEGLRWRDDVLYVAAHSAGVYVYNSELDGSLTFQATVGGFDNATKLELAGDQMYVADSEGGVRVLSLADPLAPTHTDQIETVGLARDVDIEDGTLYIATGGDGVEVFDVSGPAPVLLDQLDTDGAAQAVDADGGVLAVAEWSHLGVYDATTLQLLGTERVRATPQFEQDLGVAFVNGIAYVGEWEALHVVEHRPGYVAADITVDEEIMSFDAEEAGAKVVVVRNRGYLDLDIDSIDAGVGSFEEDTPWVRVPPLSGRSFEVSYDPVGANGSSTLTMTSNDPDANQNPFKLPLVAQATTYIDVGDPIGDQFGFLTSTGQVSELEGQVTVLAYFALF